MTAGHQIDRFDWTRSLVVDAKRLVGGPHAYNGANNFLLFIRILRIISPGNQARQTRQLEDRDMGDQHGGRREGAGRRKGSKNKATVAREAIAEVLDAPDPMKLTAAVHERGYKLLLEMEQIVLDPTQPVAARIMAAKTVLPFMLPKQSDANHGGTINEEVERLLKLERKKFQHFKITFVGDKGLPDLTPSIGEAPRDGGVGAPK